MDADAILDIVREKLIPASVNYNYPRMLSYVSSGSLTLPGLIEGLVGEAKHPCPPDRKSIPRARV